eukprot:6469090-Amphidinium_carterae.2
MARTNYAHIEELVAHSFRIMTVHPIPPMQNAFVPSAALVIAPPRSPSSHRVGVTFLCLR